MRMVVLAVGLLAATPAMAAQPWAISKSASGCMAETTFEGGSSDIKFALGRDAEGHALMVLKSNSWSTEDNKTYGFYLLIDGVLWEGQAIGGNSGAIIIHLKETMVIALTHGKLVVPFLKIDESHERPLGKFSLSGSTAAMVKVSGCLRTLSSELKSKQPAPSDPFKSQ